MDAILQPWPWYISGPLIGLTVPLLLLLANKTFGISSSFRHIGSACTPNFSSYLRNNNWRASSSTLIFVAGVILGGFIANFLLSDNPVQFLPDSYYSVGGALRLLIGGLFVGFGTRYADGCTSGHTIMGISNLRWPSLVATVFFFVGGLLSTHLILSWIGI